MLAAQRLPLRDFAWNNNSVQTVSRRKISTGSTLLGETTNPGWNERFPAGLVAQALLPVLAIVELIMSARAGRLRKPCRMNTYEKGGVQFSRDTAKITFLPNSRGITFLQKTRKQLPWNHILVKKVGGTPPGKLMQHLKSS